MQEFPFRKSHDRSYVTQLQGTGAEDGNNRSCNRARWITSVVFPYKDASLLGKKARRAKLNRPHRGKESYHTITMESHRATFRRWKWKLARPNRFSADNDSQMIPYDLSNLLNIKRCTYLIDGNVYARVHYFIICGRWNFAE